MSSLDVIRNFVQLTPTIGTAGQPSADQFALIAKAGYRSVINIAMPDHPDAIDQEGKLVSETGMNYFHIPVPFEKPELEHLRLFCRQIEILKDTKLFVHCIMNYRVSAFMYHYLMIFKGATEAQARSPIFERWQIEPQWQNFLEIDQSELRAAVND